MPEFKYSLVVNGDVYYQADTISECRKYFIKLKLRFNRNNKIINSAFICMRDLNLLEN